MNVIVCVPVCGAEEGSYPASYVGVDIWSLELQRKCS